MERFDEDFAEDYDYWEFAGDVADSLFDLVTAFETTARTYAEAFGYWSEL